MSNNFSIIRNIEKAQENIVDEYINAPLYHVGNKLADCVTIECIKDTILNSPIVNACETRKYGIMSFDDKDVDFTEIMPAENIAIVTFDVGKVYISFVNEIIGKNDKHWFIIDSDDRVRRVKITMSYFVEVE